MFNKYLILCIKKYNIVQLIMPYTNKTQLLHFVQPLGGTFLLAMLYNITAYAVTIRTIKN